MKSNMYIGYIYVVTDTAITDTERREYYLAPTRDDAVKFCLYTHRLHNGHATASPNGVVTCPNCGQIAVVKALAGSPLPKE